MRNLVTTATGLKIGLAYIPAPMQDFARDSLWLQRALIDKPRRDWERRLFDRIRKLVGLSAKAGR